jgi:hypothetical protein
VGQIHLAGAQEREACGGVRSDLDDDAVQVREPLHEVVGVALEGDLDPLLVGLHHEGAAADHRLRTVEVLVLLLGLPRQDRHVRRGGQMVEEGRERLLQGDAQGVAVHHVDRLHHVESGPERRLAHEPLDRVLRVLRGHLATVHRRLVVEVHALA